MTAMFGNINEYTKKMMEMKAKGDSSLYDKWKAKSDAANKTERIRNARSISMAKTIAEKGNWWEGRKHSEETIKKLSAVRKEICAKQGNGCEGNMWICNHSLKENKRIKAVDFDQYKNSGWVKGRNMEYTKPKNK